MTMTRLDLTRLLPGHPVQEDACIEHLKDGRAQANGEEEEAQFASSAVGAACTMQHSDTFSAAKLERFGDRVSLPTPAAASGTIEVAQ